MKRRHTPPSALAVWPAALMVAAMAAPLPASAQSLDMAPAAGRFDAALERYEVGHYAQAFAAFASLADEGHCQAARLAGQMTRYGRTLYAMELPAAHERLERWQRLPGCPLAVAAR